LKGFFHSLSMEIRIVSVVFEKTTHLGLHGIFPFTREAFHDEVSWKRVKGSKRHNGKFVS